MKFRIEQIFEDFWVLNLSHAIPDLQFHIFSIEKANIYFKYNGHSIPILKFPYILVKLFQITNPVKYVKGRPFLRPLMTAIMAQPRGTRPNYQAILDAAAGPFPIDDIRDSLKTEISLLGVRFL